MPALVLDDDADYAAMIGLVCLRLGLEPHRTGDAARLLEELGGGGCHLVVADALTVGGDDGVAAVRRASTCALVVVGAGSTEGHLDSGADHHLPKPFSPSLLRLTAQAALRRTPAVTPLARERVVLGSAVFEPGRRRLVGARGRLSLTARESDLLEFLATNAGRVVSRGQIVDGAWGGVAEASDAAVVSAIYRLRRKLRAARSSARIVAAAGRGYRLVVTPDAAVATLA
jgi:DNA-binding response OmpR family regulator